MSATARFVDRLADQVLALGAEARGLHPTSLEELDRVQESLREGAREGLVQGLTEDEIVWVLARAVSVVGLRYSPAEVRQLIRQEAGRG